MVCCDDDDDDDDGDDGATWREGCAAAAMLCAVLRCGRVNGRASAEPGAEAPTRTANETNNTVNTVPIRQAERS